MKKVIIDIGGTKTIISLMEDGRIKGMKKFETPKKRRDLLRILSESFRYANVERVNVAIAGRYQDGRVTLSPNIPLENFHLGTFFSPFKFVNIDNDTICAAKNLLKRGVKNALLINWGTGIGGAIVIDGRIYKGGGRAGEIGHLRLVEGDWEDLIGGKAFQNRFGIDGATMQKMALEGDDRAIQILGRVGDEFGEFLVSMVYLLDPEAIYLYGGVLNSWKFMRKNVIRKLRTYSMKNKLYVIRDRYFTLRGCYYLDESFVFP